LTGQNGNAILELYLYPVEGGRCAVQDVTNEVSEKEVSSAEPLKAESSIRQEVEEMKEAVEGVVTQAALLEKVEALRTTIENLSEDVQSWRTARRDTYVEALETLKSQVDEIQSEWDNVSASMKAQRDRLESMLQSFPGVIETSALRALSLRVNHLEQLVSEVFQETHARSSAAGSRRQLIISLVALGITVVLWGIWIGLAVFK